MQHGSLRAVVERETPSVITTSQRPAAPAVLKADLFRRWFFILPAVFVTYSLAYLDRANYGFGVAAGMASTLGITGQQTSMLSSVFFLGYFAFQLPGATLAKKFGVTRLVFFLLVAWGSFAALSGVITSYPLLLADRFLLGTAESLIFPAMLVLLNSWFTRSERGRSNALLILGNPLTVLWMSVITGYLIQAVGWQKTFIFEGIPSIVWAFVWILVVRDKPSKTWWLKPEAGAALEQTLTEEQLAVAPVGAVRQALLRPDVLLLAVQYFAWSVGVYGFVLWLPTIVRQGSALAMGRTGLLSAIPYLAAVLSMLLASYLSDRTQRRESLVWPFLLVAGLALLGSFLTAERSVFAAFLFLILGGAAMYAPYGPFFAIIPERLPRNVTPAVLALINSAGALGGFLGSYFVGALQAATGNPKAGFLLMSLSLIVSAVLLLFLPKAAPLTPPPLTLESGA